MFTVVGRFNSTPERRLNPCRMTMNYKSTLQLSFKVIQLRDRRLSGEPACLIPRKAINLNRLAMKFRRTRVKLLQNIMARSGWPTLSTALSVKKISCRGKVMEIYKSHLSL